jgi:hypothetical protein
MGRCRVKKVGVILRKVRRRLEIIDSAWRGDGVTNNLAGASQAAHWECGHVIIGTTSDIA